MSETPEMTLEQLEQIEKNEKGMVADARDRAFFFDDDGVTVFGKRLRKMDARTFGILLDLGNGFVQRPNPSDPILERRQYQVMEFVWVHGAPKDEVAAAVIGEPRAKIAERAMDFFGKTFEPVHLEALYGAIEGMITRLELASNFKEAGGPPSGASPPNSTGPDGSRATS